MRHALGLPLVTIPRSTAVGEAIAFVREQMQTEEGLTKKYTFSGAVLFAHLGAGNLYTMDIPAIRGRVAEAGFLGFFEQLPS